MSLSVSVWSEKRKSVNCGVLYRCASVALSGCDSFSRLEGRGFGLELCRCPERSSWIFLVSAVVCLFFTASATSLLERRLVLLVVMIPVLLTVFALLQL